MGKSSTTDFFTQEASIVYDDRNRQLAPIADNMYFLIRLILRELPARSRVLCVGVGTGAEILSLSKAFPQWTFVGVDPSSSMLDVCRKRLGDAGVSDRCELIHGYADDVSPGENFDVALSVFVAHFVRRDGRLGFFRAMCDRLRTGGYLINAEIGFDLNSEEFPSMLKGWEGIQSMRGATPESLSNLSCQLREVLTVLPPEETESLINRSGIRLPVRFFQAFMIFGWYGKKE